MIKSFKHKGLKQFFETGSIAKIDDQHQSKLRLILTDVDAAVTIEDMYAPAYSLHKLKWDRNNIHSVKVNGNW